MFGGDDDDADFLSPTGGAKLASLFGLDQAASHGNESFQYTAPKQPRKSSTPVPPSQKHAAPPGAPAVLLATAVQAFRYINGQYVKQGKLGAAVLGNHSTKEYKLLLYVSQQKQVTAARIHTGFVFTVQPNNYCTFYDDQRQNWSLMFETEKVAIDFCKEVCLAKVNSAPSLDAVVVQDLSLGDGQAVENGDSLQVAYTGWLLQNHAIGQVFDSNVNKDKLFRLKLGAGKVIKGWEEGMLGMKKAGRRVMVIPPSLAYGSKGVANHVPADSTLVFEAELRRVKFSKDSGSDQASASSRDSNGPSAAPSPAPSVENMAPEVPAQPTATGPNESPLRAKSNSLSEQLTNPDATKAKLISRMAKMGQPMFPVLTGVTSQPDSSDSELEDSSVSRAKDRPAAPSPVQISTAPPGPAQVLSQPHATQPSALLPVNMTTSAPQHGIGGTTHAFQPYSYTQTSVAPSQLQPVYHAQTVPYMGSSDVTSFLMTEARQHNTEIRLAVGKVADKVEQLSSKMDDLQRQGNVTMGMSSMSMETSMIMHNIQRIVQENECLKKEVFEKSSRIEEQNRKIGELINQNQRYVEQSNLLLEQRSDSLKSSSEHNQTRLLQAEQDKHALPQDLGSGQVHLTEELASSTSRVAQLQLDATSHQQRASELQNKLAVALQDGEGHCARVSTLETQLEELKESSERTQAQYRTEKQKRKEMEVRVSNVEEEAQDLKTDKENLERTLADRKRKWQAERQSRDEEMEELRRSNQQELDNLRAQLRKARTSTDTAASEQLSQLQTELEQEWKGRCEQALASVKEHHGREVADLQEQRDALEQKLTQIQEKFTALKQSRESEEQSLMQQQGQQEELQALKEKYMALERQSVSVKDKLEGRVAELENELADQSHGDTANEVKRVMNGVFHSLRGEFDLSESYTGQAVLGVIVGTIKNVTLQLLSGTDQRSSLQSIKQEEDEEEDEEEEDDESVVNHSEERPPGNTHVNGKKEEEGEEQRAECQSAQPRVAWAEAQPGGVAAEKVDEEVVAAEEEETTRAVAECEMQSQSECIEVIEVTHHPPAGPVAAALAETVEAAPVTDGQVQEEVPSAVEPSSHPHKEHNAHLSPVVLADGQPEEEDTHSKTRRACGTESDTSMTEPGVHKDGVDDAKGPLGDQQHVVTTHKVTGPPTQPPPPPSPLQERSTDKVTSLTEGVGKENGEEPFFQSTTTTTSTTTAAAAKPPPPPAEEDEEEELSMKGRPPPAPLFGEDDDDDDDLDWLG